MILIFQCETIEISSMESQFVCPHLRRACSSRCPVMFLYAIVETFCIGKGRTAYSVLQEICLAATPVKAATSTRSALNIASTFGA